jgi:DNA-binding NtrC family response regulator
MANRGVLYLKIGRIRTGAQLLLEGRTIAAKAGRERLAEWFTLALSIAHRIRSEHAEALALLKQTLATSRRLQLKRDELLSLEFLADVFADQGKQRRARILLRAVRDLSRKHYPDSDMVSESERRLAEVCVELGFTDEARTSALESLRVSDKIQDPYELALAHRAMGRVLHAQARLKDARRHYDLCESGLRELGETFELAKTLLHLGRLAAESGDILGGTERVDAASLLFAAEELTNWTARAETARAACLAAQRKIVHVTASGRQIPPPALHGIVTADDRIIAIFRDIARIAKGQLSVLLEGESGTGKELFARAVHDMSPRSSRIFVSLNAGAIPHEMQEAEFFGHARGAFTGAHADRLGYFAAANGGTLFLDEIGEMSPSSQVKLLRVIETGVFTRVGDVRPHQVDVRYVAATNVDLDRACGEGRFRIDLFHRLNGLRVRIPALRERKGDIPLLIEHFLSQFEGPRPRIGRTLLTLLMDYSWPGNVRELKSSIVRAVELADDALELDPSHFPFLATSAAAPPVTDSVALIDDLEAMERRHILDALEKSRWQKSGASRLLGISRTTLTSKMTRLGIPLDTPERFRLPRR